MAENGKWKDISANEQIKLSLSIVLIFASVILGFVSFLMLEEIPGSVLAQSGVWLSGALALLGITSYFNNELIKMRTQVRNKIDELNNAERKFKDDIEEEKEQ